MKVQKVSTKKGYRYIVLNSDYTPNEYINSFLKQLDICNKSVATLKTYATHLKIYGEYLESVSLTVTSIFEQEKSYFEILLDYVLYLQNENQCQKHRTPQTINYMLTPVCKMYEYLSSISVTPNVNLYKSNNKPNGAIANKSFLYETTRSKGHRENLLHLRVVDDESFKYISKTQFTIIQSACHNLRDKILVSLLFECGLRIGEALGIHLSDISLSDGEITIIHRENNDNDSRVKNKANGKVYLPDYLIDLLIEYISSELVDYDTEYLFVNLYGNNKGATMTKSNVESLFRRLSKETGISVHPHMLRHGFGTMASEANIKTEVIQQMMRHKNVNTTMKYVHINNARKKDAAIKIQESKHTSVDIIRNGVIDKNEHNN